MGINKKILRIIERCTSEVAESVKLKTLLSEDCLKFKEPVSLETLKQLRLSAIISETTRSAAAAMMSQRLTDNVHAAEPAYAASDNFI